MATWRYTQHLRRPKLVGSRPAMEVSATGATQREVRELGVVLLCPFFTVV